ncbi:MAG: hypothetical protein FKY71_17295 [Spiribacter salinus]|uniref:Uncharacterized protein n=1 Tax=Spiribacter salinus TaxID=1335746 RepID=A0A540VES8_9GAMM|nr:MAG: hypothetical protein FKY71_17295 [Spiribacter salinus]
MPSIVPYPTDSIPPMVFFGEAYWTEEKPVYPLLQQLATSHTYAELLTISDDAASVVAFMASHEPLATDGLEH